MSVVKNTKSHIWAQILEILTSNLDLSVALNWTARWFNRDNNRSFDVVEE